MKTCTKCLRELLESEFYIRDKKVGRLHAQCKQCHKEHRQSYHNAHYLRYREEYLQRADTRRKRLRDEFRQNMLSYLSSKSCLDCGESDIRVLELDHIDPNTKKFNVSQAVRLGYSWDDVLSEIQKCRILCANCHKKRTALQFNWYKNI